MVWLLLECSESNQIDYIPQKSAYELLISLFLEYVLLIQLKEHVIFLIQMSGLSLESVNVDSVDATYTSNNYQTGKQPHGRIPLQAFIIVATHFCIIIIIKN